MLYALISALKRLAFMRITVRENFGKKNIPNEFQRGNHSRLLH